MKVAVYSPKGGVGKTSISLNLALELDWFLISNDEFGGVVELLNKGRSRAKGLLVKANDKDITNKELTVYDFGGFRDNRVQVILKAADVVIIPTLHSYSDIKATLSTIVELQTHLHQTNIIIAINKVSTSSKKKDEKGEKDYADYVDTKANIKAFISQNNLEKVKFIKIRDNKSWKNSTSKGKSLKDLANKSPLVKNSSKSGIEDLDKLVKLVRKYWN